MTEISREVPPAEWDRMLQELCDREWTMSTQCVPKALCFGLLARAQELEQRGVLMPAGIGRGAAVHIDRQQRRDQITWLEEGTQDPWERSYLELVHEWMRGLRTDLHLALHEFEGHFAVYDVGTFYRKHRDRFRHESRREISVVLFLNPDWTAADAGCLRLYRPEDPAVLMATIPPQFGTLVLFRSASIPHEVEEPQRRRYSVAGWMCSRS